ncbi:MAG: hypothetical protein KAI47_01565 [Deltaproteobacteria bacterium]|nr:hypothetical protein [Deltaproteobacteria bacterium]
MRSSFIVSATFVFALALPLEGCTEVAVAPDLGVTGDGIAGDGSAGSTFPPGEPGPCRVSDKKDLQINRSGRNIFLSIRLPNPNPLGPVICQRATPAPIIFITPASQQDIGQYDSYAKHLASHGFATLAIAYPNDPVQADHREAAHDLRAVIDWAKTQNATFASPYHGRLSWDHVAVTGHGSGAVVGLLAALENPRILALAGMDPVDGNPYATTADPRYPSVVPQFLDRFTGPLLLLGETTNGTCASGGCRACAPFAENYQRFFASANASAAAIEVSFAGADHNDWLDDPHCGFLCDACREGTAKDDAVRGLSRKYLTAFFAWTLRGDIAAIESLCTSAHPEPAPAQTRVSCQDNGKLPSPTTGDGGADAGDGGAADTNSLHDMAFPDQPATD